MYQSKKYKQRQPGEFKNMFLLLEIPCSFLNILQKDTVISIANNVPIATIVTDLVSMYIGATRIIATDTHQICTASYFLFAITYSTDLSVFAFLIVQILLQI